ncbi:hypothetical protein [Qipengyuania flava]|uniref:hypothetical protein n=1 Tax=Qipengyuania flava TaxID=192812 RepID=UPI00321BA197
MDDDLKSLERWEPLNIQIGQLFLGFARLETCLSLIVRRSIASRMNKRRHTDGREFAAVILGSQRFKALNDTIKRIVAHEDALTEEQRASLSDLFNHCGHIAGLRDKFAHQSVLPHPDKKGAWLISDTFSTRDLSNERVWTTTTHDICNAAIDLRSAVRWLSSDRTGKLLEFIPSTPPAWRYKSSSLRRLKTETAHSLRKRAVQPPPSPA